MNKFAPVAVYDAFGYTRQLWLAAERDGEVVSIVASDTTRNDLFVRTAFIGQIGPPGHKTRLVTSDVDTQILARQLKAHALKWGATPEAIRLLGLICPFEEKEYNMVRLARKEELKEAAAAAPVAARRGRPAKAAVAEAAAAPVEASEPRSTKPDMRKLKILNKENPYREGSNRAASFDALTNAKTAENYLDAGGAKKYIARWADEGLIEVD